MVQSWECKHTDTQTAPFLWPRPLTREVIIRHEETLKNHVSNNVKVLFYRYVTLHWIDNTERIRPSWHYSEQLFTTYWISLDTPKFHTLPMHVCGKFEINQWAKGFLDLATVPIIIILAKTSESIQVRTVEKACQTTSRGSAQGQN